jgi:hypothetical protein
VIQQRPVLLWVKTAIEATLPTMHAYHSEAVSQETDYERDERGRVEGFCLCVASSMMRFTCRLEIPARRLISEDPWQSAASRRT